MVITRLRATQTHTSLIHTQEGMHIFVFWGMCTHSNHNGTVGEQAEQQQQQQQRGLHKQQRLSVEIQTGCVQNKSFWLDIQYSVSKTVILPHSSLLCYLSVQTEKNMWTLSALALLVTHQTPHSQPNTAQPLQCARSTLPLISDSASG